MIKTIQFNYEEYESKDELNTADSEILEHAQRAVSHASAQFSNFHVGAAVRLSDGSIHTSANKENTSILNCAEQSLLLHLHSVYREFTIETIAIAFKNMNPGTNSDFPITPCGKCRQLLVEAEDAAKNSMRILMSGQSGKIYIVNSANAMLPLAHRASVWQR